MARLTFPATAQGIADAEAVAQPRHILVRTGRDVLVFTGSDMPESLDPRSVTLTKQQLLYGVLQVGGQPLWTAVLAYIANMSATGTPNQKNHWNYCNEFRRLEIYTRQLRLDPSIKGVKTEPQSVAEWDQIFIVGSGYEPPMSAG